MHRVQLEAVRDQHLDIHQDQVVGFATTSARTSLAAVVGRIGYHGQRSSRASATLRFMALSSTTSTRPLNGPAARQLRRSALGLAAVAAGDQQLGSERGTRKWPLSRAAVDADRPAHQLGQPADDGELAGAAVQARR